MSSVAEPTTTQVLSQLKDIVLVFGAIFGVWKIIQELGHQKKVFKEAQNLKEREDIRYKLNNFFGPFKALRTESRLLYDVFAKGPKQEVMQRTGKDYFRTLRFLAEGNDFSSTDSAILNEILKIEQKEIELIEKEGWAVNNLKMSELLGKFAAHIRLLALASEHKIDGLSDELKHIVYPREMDGAIESEIRRLEDQYNGLLLGTPQKLSKKRLSVSEEETIAYYDTHHLDYFSKTAFLDMKDLYDKFTALLPRGALILDAGCGVGRDTRYFIKSAFRVVSFDASAEMVKMCNEYPFAYCTQKSFEEIEYSEEFDGVWACASLVHVPHTDLLQTFSRIFRCLKPGGIFYFSLKLERGGGNYRDGRNFYYYDQGAIKNILSVLPFNEVETWVGESKLPSEDQWRSFIWKKPQI